LRIQAELALKVGDSLKGLFELSDKFGDAQVTRNQLAAKKRNFGFELSDACVASVRWRIHTC
jgi:hypothetical protein